MAAETGDTPVVVEGAAAPTPAPAPSTVDLPVRSKQDAAPPAGQALTGKQEHCELRCALFYKFMRCDNSS
jgi:hypothetical protein